MKQVTKPVVKARSILAEADILINGEKQEDYGPASKNLTDIANLWTAYLAAKYGTTLPLVAEDTCQMMVLLKMARGFNGAKKRDTIVDQAGYTGLLEIIDRE